MKSKSLNLILLPSIALFLSACGGGGSSSSNTDQNSIIDTPIANIQPTALSAVNWQSARLLQKSDPMETTVEVVGSELRINVLSDDISQGDHLQIYINSDNKAETGFQFVNQAWEDSGVDYLIEDGDLFKSTANNSGWNWNTNAGEIDYTLNNNSASAKIDLSLLGDICNNLNIGVMTRDEGWNIVTFSPASSQMQTFNVSYCNTETPDTKSPLMSLLGANPLTITTGNELIDPGATAIDDIDGDITSTITSESNVNTDVAGSYVINYFATDISGNSSAIGRQVIVNDISPPEGIVVDGNINDWNDIPTFNSSANGIMKVSDDEDKIYILVTSSNLGDNIQVLMDTDNNVATGLNLSSQISAWLGGADHMIENNSLDKSKSNNLWSWDFGIAPIEYLKSSDVLEIAIKKSDLNALANQIPMGFVSRTVNWNVNYILPEQALPSYTLKFPVIANPVIANNDTISTLNTDIVNIDVLKNDFSLITNELTIISVNQAQSGTAVIEQNKVIYTPDPTFTGTVNFTYLISDSIGNTNSASIKVIVTAPTNTPPVANDDSAITPKGEAVTLNVIGNDSSNSGSNTVTITSVSSPSNGTAQIVNNQIIYTPSANFVGTDIFTYTITDSNGETSTATIIVTAYNPKPIAKNDSVTIPKGEAVTLNVLNNDSSNSGSAQLTISDISNPSNGSASFVNGEIVYTPNANFVGIDTFNYTIMDSNGKTATATVTVTIVEQNIPPIANDDVVTTNGIKTLRIFVENNDIDPDGNGAGVELNNDYTQPANGTVARNTPSTLDYTPNPTFSGTDIFTYSITDINGATATATVFVTVPVNNAPDAVEDVADVDFNKTITINVLNNDTDPDDDVLSVQSIVQPPVGFATLNADGTIFFNPQNTVGSISIGYTVSDSRGGTDFAVLTVSSTDPNDSNDAFPDITNEQVSTPINTSIFIPVLANDSDADGDTLVLDQVDQGENGGTTEKVTRNGVLGVLYTPPIDYIGPDFFYYGVHDGHGHNGSGRVDVTVTP